MTESLIGKSLINVATFVGLAVPLVGLGMYVNNLTNQIDTSKVEVAALKAKVEQLQGLLQQTQAGTLAGQRGPKGDKGDTGDQGPRGERGLQGETGPMGPAGTGGGMTEAQVRQLVQQLIQQNGSATPTTGGKVQIAVDDGADVFNSSGCVALSTVKSRELLVLRKGQEFCDSDGRLVAHVKTFESSGYISMARPGELPDACSVGRTCKLRWLGGQQYVYERLGEDEKGPIALLRIKK